MAAPFSVPPPGLGQEVWIEAKAPDGKVSSLYCMCISSPASCMGVRSDFLTLVCDRNKFANARLGAHHACREGRGAGATFSLGTKIC